MRGLHQLEELCGFVRPQWGLVTNVGESHIELLGSRENIARAKAELLEALPAGGIDVYKRQPLHLPARSSGVHVRQGADTQGAYPKAHRPHGR